MPVVRSPVLRLILGLAVAGIATVFVLFRPQYHDPSPGTTIDLSGYAPPAHGWTWDDGQPGYRFGENESDWNTAEIGSGELATMRAAAAAAGVSPDSVLPLATSRYAPHSLSLIVAGSDGAGETCLGFAVPRHKPRFLCQDALAPNAAYVVTVPYTDYPKALSPPGGPDGAFVSGIARGDVTHVVVHQAGLPPAQIYQRAWGAWGTFFASLGSGPIRNGRNEVIANPRGARLDFFAGKRRIASLPIRFARARNELLPIAG